MSNPSEHPNISYELKVRAEREPGMLLIATNGRPFKPIPRPKGVRLRSAKQCYRNVGNFVLEHESDFLYCEGLAVSGDGAHCVPHAWICPIETWQAVDVTWRQPGVAYFGIALAEPALVRAMNKSMTYGPFVNVIDPTEVDLCPD